MGTDVQTSLLYPNVPLAKDNSVSLVELLQNKIQSNPQLKKRTNVVEPVLIIISEKELTKSADSSDLNRDFQLTKRVQEVLKASPNSQEQKTASKPPVSKMSSKFLDDLRKKGSL